ncbi:MAG TPA: excisionase family DNA-binding protein [Acidimicrobiales bacterium]|jgi:excisionase family DNA binding protein|nr:excisionase family DNA-binding protein [Acidimicrobiales bacterium]
MRVTIRRATELYPELSEGRDGKPSERFFRRLVEEKRIPYFKVDGGKVLIDTDDVDALIEAGRVEAERPLRIVRGRAS